MTTKHRYKPGDPVLIKHKEKLFLGYYIGKDDTYGSPLHNVQIVFLDRAQGQLEFDNNVLFEDHEIEPLMPKIRRRRKVSK